MVNEKEKYFCPLFELHSLDFNIRTTYGSCNVVSNEAEYICPMKTDDMPLSIFASTNDACESTAEDPSAACYSTPMSDYVVHTS